MNEGTVLMRLDVERQTVAGADVTLENTPRVVRAIGKEASWNGIVYARWRVDALPTSQPILEKYGFKTLGSTWPADWPVSLK